MISAHMVPTVTRFRDTSLSCQPVQLTDRQMFSKTAPPRYLDPRRLQAPPSEAQNQWGLWIFPSSRISESHIYTRATGQVCTLPTTAASTAEKASCLSQLLYSHTKVSTAAAQNQNGAFSLSSRQQVLLWESWSEINMPPLLHWVCGQPLATASPQGSSMDSHHTFPLPVSLQLATFLSHFNL